MNLLKRKRGTHIIPARLAISLSVSLSTMPFPTIIFAPRKFLFCLPVRVGVFVLSVGSLLAAAFYAFTAWYFYFRT
jgi:hypothetical protein